MHHAVAGLLSWYRKLKLYAAKLTNRQTNPNISALLRQADVTIFNPYQITGES
jgi:hypothetical protein